MNVKILNPFLDAAAEVVAAECHTSVNRGNLTLQKSSMTADEVTVLISLIGNIQGVALYGMSTQTGLGLVSRVMDQTFTEFDSLAQSGVAELGNVISGQATVKLSQAGYSADISPPTLILGKGLIVSTLDFPRIVVPLTTEVGDVMVHLALREAPSGTADSVYVPITLPALAK
jgi:chemotaxis protein CheX